MKIVGRQFGCSNKATMRCWTIFSLTNSCRRRKKISYVRKRRDIYKALGPGANTEKAAILAFGSLFSSPYKGSVLYIDIHEAPKDPWIQSLINKIEFLPFSPEIISAGKEFAIKKIKEPFLCAQLRLLDGQFKNHWKLTFLALKQKIRSLQLESKETHIFIMTDLPPTNWSGTYLAELKKDTKSYKLHTLHENDDFIVQTAKKTHGIKSSFLPKDLEGMKMIVVSESVTLPDVLLYIEGTVCSCASKGFVVDYSRKH